MLSRLIGAHHAGLKWKVIFVITVGLETSSKLTNIVEGIPYE